MNFVDIFTIVAFIFAVLTMTRAIIFTWLYATRETPVMRYYREAKFMWIASLAFLVVSAATNGRLPTAVAVLIVVVAAIVAAVPIVVLNRIRTQRQPTFVDQIAADDRAERNR